MQDFSEGPVVDLNWIFEGPIEAVIKANVMAATAFYDFLARYGFVVSKDDPDQGKMLGELRMVSFSFEQPSGDAGAPVTRVFRVPFLSLVQLPLLEVKEATFDFGVRVLAAFPSETVRRVSLLRDSDEPDPPPVTWRAALASGGTNQGDETRPDLSPHLDANLTARVSVGQADIPAGIRNLLALMGENAQVTPPLLEANRRHIRIPQCVAETQPGDTIIPPLPILPVEPLVLTAVTNARRPDSPRRIRALYPDGLRLWARSTNDEWVLWPNGTARPADANGRIEASAVWASAGLPEDNTIAIVFRSDIDGASALVEVKATIFQPNIAGPT